MILKKCKSAVTLSLGVLIAFGISSLIGLFLPNLKIWVFIILSIYWLYLGWKYTSARDQASKIRIPENCNFSMVRDEIADFFIIANQEAKEKGGHYVFPEELAKAWYRFKNNPCSNTANDLLKVAPNLYQYFKACSPGDKVYSKY